MSFKVGDEIVTTKSCAFFKKNTKGVVIDKSWGDFFVDFGDIESAPAGHVRTRRFWTKPSEIAHACPIARESAKLAAKVEQLEAEVNAWIERMRRGWW